MKKQLELGKKKIEYTLKLSQRARRMRLAVYCDGNFVVTAPQSFSLKTIEQFINQKANWLINKLEYFKSFTGQVLPKISKKDYLKYKAAARVLAQSRLEYFNQFYNFKFNRVNIKNQKTRWGSCSLKGNLNFNYKIALLSPKVADYVIVHELCHVKEFNHSRAFWDLVAQVIPDYINLRNELKKNRIGFF